MLKNFRAHLRGNVVGYLALFVALGGTTYAATGGNFILGKLNSASDRTELSAPVSGKTLRLNNTSTQAGATALGLSVASGHPPFTVNSTTRVLKLNADKLDGHDASCPANSFLSRGLCFENSARTADAWGPASDLCASLGGMLPTLDQLRPTRLLPGVDLGSNDAEAEWTSDIGQTDSSTGGSTGLTALAVRDNGGVIIVPSPFSVGSEHPYRCVFALVR
jgi:hypothetical protein